MELEKIIPSEVTGTKKTNAACPLPHPDASFGSGDVCLKLEGTCRRYGTRGMEDALREGGRRMYTTSKHRAGVLWMDRMKVGAWSRGGRRKMC